MTNRRSSRPSPGASRAGYFFTSFDMQYSAVRSSHGLTENTGYRIPNDEPQKSPPTSGGWCTSPFGIRYSSVRHSTRGQEFNTPILSMQCSQSTLPGPENMGESFGANERMQGCDAVFINSDYLPVFSCKNLSVLASTCRHFIPSFAKLRTPFFTFHVSLLTFHLKH